MAGEIQVEATNTGSVDWKWGAWYKLDGQDLPIFKCTNIGTDPVQFNAFTFWSATAKSNKDLDKQGFSGEPIKLKVNSSLHNNAPTEVTISTVGQPFMQNPGGTWGEPNNYNFTTNGVRDTTQGAEFITAIFDSTATLNHNESVDISFEYDKDLSKGIQWYPTDIGMDLIVSHTVWSYHTGEGWKKDKDIYIYNNGTWVKQTKFHLYSGGSWS